MTLEILTADSLTPFRHGFFTRRGGASSGIFSGLNCGPGSTDQSDSVRLNRTRVANAMGVMTDALVTIHQTHSSDVVTLNAPLPEGKPKPRADAIVTATPGLALGILTADCQPVLFADPVAQVIGAAHAGWRGALSGVLENTVDAMITLGAQRERINAVIGPCISQKAYEVGEDFLESFLSEDSDFSRFFINGASEKYHFDLVGFGLSQLRNAGLANASWIGHCTYADPARFYSYRRSVHEGLADYGRLISVIRI